MMNKLTSQTFGYAGKIGLMAFIPFLILKIVTVVYGSGNEHPGFMFIIGFMEIAAVIIMMIPSVWLTYSLYKELFTDLSYKNWALPYKKSQIIRSKALPVIIVVSILVSLILMTDYVEGYLAEAIYGSHSQNDHLLSDMKAGLLSLSIPAYFLTLFLFSNIMGSSINAGKRRTASLFVLLLGTTLFVAGSSVFSAINWNYATTFTQTDILIVIASSLLIAAIVIMSIIMKNLADKKLDVA